MDTSRKKRLRNKRDRSSIQAVKIKNVDDLQLALLPKKRAKTEISSTPSNMMIKSSEKSSDGSYSQQRSAINAAQPSATADVIKKMSEESKEILKVLPVRQKAEFKPLIHFGFDDQLSGKLPPSHTKLLMVIDDMSRLWVLSCRKPPCFQ